MSNFFVHFQWKSCNYIWFRGILFLFCLKLKNFPFLYILIRDSVTEGIRGKVAGVIYNYQRISLIKELRLSFYAVTWRVDLGCLSVMQRMDRANTDGFLSLSERNRNAETSHPCEWWNIHTLNRYMSENKNGKIITAV